MLLTGTLAQAAIARVSGMAHTSHTYRSFPTDDELEESAAVDQSVDRNIMKRSFLSMTQKEGEHSLHRFLGFIFLYTTFLGFQEPGESERMPLSAWA